MTIEKNKIASSARVAALEGPDKQAANDLIKACLGLLHDSEAVSRDITYIPPSGLVLNQEELLSSPALTMQLRMTIAQQVWSELEDDFRVDQLNLCKLIDADPFLGSLDEMKKANAIAHLSDILSARQQWHLIKTVRISELQIPDSRLQNIQIPNSHLIRSIYLLYQRTTYYHVTITSHLSCSH